MLVTAFLSMWISNTATTAMMIPIAQSVVMQLLEQRKEVYVGSNIKYIVKESSKLPYKLHIFSNCLLSPPNKVCEGTMKRAPYVCVCVSVRPCVCACACVRASGLKINEKCYFSVISWPILILFVLSDRAWCGLQNFYTEF